MDQYLQWEEERDPHRPITEGENPSQEVDHGHPTKDHCLRTGDIKAGQGLELQKDCIIQREVSPQGEAGLFLRDLSPHVLVSAVDPSPLNDGAGPHPNQDRGGDHPHQDKMLDPDPEVGHFLPGGCHWRELEAGQGLFHQTGEEKYLEDLAVDRIHLNIHSIHLTSHAHH